MSKLLKRLSRIVENPGIIKPALKGIYPTYASYCLTVKELLKKEPKTIIDIGANNGEFIDSITYYFPNAKIYAFEPIKECFDKMKNKPNVTAYNFGLGDKLAALDFYENGNGEGTSSYLKIENELIKNFNFNKSIKIIKSEIKRFDSLDIKIERPCFAKIDVEGYEEKVISGIGDKLNEIDILQIEWIFGKSYAGCMDLSKVINHLAKYGFIGFIKKSVVWVKDKPLCCDLIFFKEKSP